MVNLNPMIIQYFWGDLNKFILIFPEELAHTEISQTFEGKNVIIFENKVNMFSCLDKFNNFNGSFFATS